MSRLRYNGLKATLGGALTSSGTTITFTAALTYNNGTAVPTITSPNYIPLTILDSSGNLSEIVWLTAYTAGATTGTISRGQESTTGVSHASGDKVVHAQTSLDANRIGAMLRVSDGTTMSSIGSGNTNAVAFDTVDASSHAAFTCSAAAGTITVPYTGWYYVEARARAASNQAGEWDCFIYPSIAQGELMWGQANVYGKKVTGAALIAAGTAVSLGMYKDNSISLKSPTADDRTYLRVLFLG